MAVGDDGITAGASVVTNVPPGGGADDGVAVRVWRQRA